MVCVCARFRGIFLQYMVCNSTPLTSNITLVGLWWSSSSSSLGCRSATEERLSSEKRECGSAKCFRFHRHYCRTLQHTAHRAHTISIVCCTISLPITSTTSTPSTVPSTDHQVAETSTVQLELYTTLLWGVENPSQQGPVIRCSVHPLCNCIDPQL